MLLGVANAMRISSGFLLAAGITAAARYGLLLGLKRLE